MRQARLRLHVATASATKVGCLVGGDADEPRPEAVRAAQARQAAPGCGQRLLQRIVRVALVPQLYAQVAVEPRAVAHHERLERGRAPELSPPHELGVVYRGKRFSVARSRRLRIRHSLNSRGPGREGSLAANDERDALGRALAEGVRSGDAEAERAFGLRRAADDAGLLVQLQAGRELAAGDCEGNAGLPATARSFAEYASPTLAGRKRVVRRSSALTIVIVAPAVAVWPLASRTPSVNEKVPNAVGLPLTAPVAGSSVTPGGSARSRATM